MLAKLHLNTLNGCLLIACVVALCLHFYLATIGWYASLGGPHDFRQTQTAIATWYFVQDGFALNYKIPVLGPEWRLPHEFPLYQALVASLVKVTGMPLEPAGRLISLLCFYSCLPIVVLLLRQLKVDTSAILATLLLTLSTSTYIFYSRTFLIESLALLLTLSFVLGSMQVLYREGSVRIIDSWVVAVGVLAALVKVTTFSIGFGLVILLIALKLLATANFWKQREWQIKLIFLTIALSLSVVAAFAWNQFILASWARSPQYADAHLGIQRWNFGELMQRNRPEFWARMFSHLLEKPFGSILLGLVSLAGFAFATRSNRLLAFAFLTAWFAGFLVWANLYYVHDYYVYASAIYFVIWSAISLNSATKVYPLLRWPVALVWLAFTVGQFAHYLDNMYFSSQKNDWGVGKRDFSVSLQAQVPDGQVLLIFGDDWSPFIPYYAERYANMVRWQNFWRSERYEESLAMMVEENRVFGGIVVRNETVHLEDMQNFVEHHQLNIGPAIISDWGDWIFHPLNTPFPQ